MFIVTEGEHVGAPGWFDSVRWSGYDVVIIARLSPRLERGAWKYLTEGTKELLDIYISTRSTSFVDAQRITVLRVSAAGADRCQHCTLIKAYSATRND